MLLVGPYHLSNLLRMLVRNAPSRPRPMWIKGIILEVVVTLVILYAVLTDAAWARWFVLIYTPFMLLLKAIALAGPRLIRTAGAAAEVPDWFWHLNYAVNVALLLAAAWWLPALGWALIWLLSIAAAHRSA